MSQLDELRSKLAVHIDALHLDAQEQPDLAYRVGELAAEAKAEARRMRMEYEETKAATDKEVRLFPEKFGVIKTTESSIASAVTLAPLVKEAHEQMIAADKDADKANALRDAFHHRKSMLQLEGELFMANYWGEVEVRGHNMRQAKDAGAKQTENELRKRRSTN